MKSKDHSISMKDRAAVKKASRRNDFERIAQGVSSAQIQRENSIFPLGYFELNQIVNFSSAIGK
ncbi:MAG: hypothetical protein V4727_02445 [Verrucomicrobiota bacterium]